MLINRQFCVAVFFPYFGCLESNTFAFGRHDVLTGTSQTKLKTIFLKTRYGISPICVSRIPDPCYFSSMNQTSVENNTLTSPPPDFFFGQLFEGKRHKMGPTSYKPELWGPYKCLYTSATGCNETWVISPHL